MTTAQTIWDEDRTERDLADAMTVLDICRETLNAAIARLRADEPVGAGEIRRELKDMSNALQDAVQAERKAREQRAKATGGVGHGALDLAAARDEIECRMACLRAARDDGGVS